MTFDFSSDRHDLCRQLKIENEDVKVYDRMVSYLNVGLMRGVILEKERENILSRIEFKVNVILEELKNDKRN